MHTQQGLTIVTVLHDLGIAAEYAQRAIVLDAGRVVLECWTHRLSESERLCESYRASLNLNSNFQVNRGFKIPHLSGQSNFMSYFLNSQTLYVATVG